MAMDDMNIPPLLAMGLGILSNNYGNYGALGPALGRGMTQGMLFSQQQQQLAMERALQQAQIQHYNLQNAGLDQTNQVISGLSPEDRVFAKLAPGEYVKSKIPQPFTLSPGQTRYQGDQPIASTPQTPQLVTVADPNNPGQSIQKWVVPGQTEGSAIGQAKRPDILDPEVFARELAKANASATRVQQNVAAYTPASVAAQTDYMKKMSDRHDALATSPVLLKNIHEAKNLAMESNPFIGSFGDKKMAVAQFFNNNFGTNIDPTSVARAQELQTRLFYQIMENLKKMDAQPSQMQQQIMQESLGKITSDPGALPRIMDVLDQTIRGKVDVYNQEAQSAEGRGVKFPFDPYIKLQTATPTPGKVIDFHSLPKGR